MKNLTLKNLQTVTGGKLVNAKDVMNTEITSVVSDSRKIREDCLFLCIKGERADGHDFAAKAVTEQAKARSAVQTIAVFFMVNSSRGVDG